MIERFKPRSEFSRNIVTLMTGTTFAQAIPLAMSPILSRLYSPEDFGILALFMSVVSIMAVLATGKYDLAILLPKNNIDAINIAALAMILSIIVSISFVFIIFFFKDWLDLSFFQDNNEMDWIYIVPLMIFLLSFYQILMSYENRHKNYKNIAISRVYQSISTAITNVSSTLIFTSYWGLIAGRVIGAIVSIYTLISNITKNNIIAAISVENMKKQAKRYKRFPKYSLPSDFSSLLSNELPIFMFAILYNSTIIGLYAFTLRVVGTPMSIIGSAVSSVFREEAAKNYAEEGNCIQIFQKTVKLLFFLAIIPFSILAIYAPDIFLFVFGNEWKIAGEFTQIMVIMFFFKFIVSPISYMYFIAEKQDEDLYLHIFILLSSFLVIYLGYYLYHDAYYSILFYSLNYMMIYIYTASRSYYFARGDI